jgi:hypothetical protein
MGKTSIKFCTTNYGDKPHLLLPQKEVTKSINVLEKSRRIISNIRVEELSTISGTGAAIWSQINFRTTGHITFHDVTSALMRRSQGFCIVLNALWKP